MLDDSFREIALLVSEALGGPYAAATLNYPGVPTYDSGGSIQTPGTPTTQSCHVQIDSADENMRADADFIETDVMMIVLGPTALDSVPTVTVNAGPFSGITYSIHSVQRDTLGFGWLCRGRKVGV